jgi:hypothetical protein
MRNPLFYSMGSLLRKTPRNYRAPVGNVPLFEEGGEID